MEYRARYNVKEGEESEVLKNEAEGSNGPGEHNIEMKGGGKAGGQMEDILALGLSSRKNLCIHPDVSRERKGKVVDARCRDMTSSWACEKGRQDPGSVELCDFHEELGKMEPGQLIPQGVWTLEEVKEYARDKGICPYFAIRRMMPFVDIIIYSFHYLLDPKVAEQVSKEMSKDAIVVFDEAHNIDNVCIESLSIDLTRPMLDSAYRSIKPALGTCRRDQKDRRIQAPDEYARSGRSTEQGEQREAESFMANPVLPDDLLQEAYRATSDEPSTLLPS